MEINIILNQTEAIVGFITGPVVAGVYFLLKIYIEKRKWK